MSTFGAGPSPSASRHCCGRESDRRRCITISLRRPTRRHSRHAKPAGHQHGGAVPRQPEQGGMTCPVMDMSGMDMGECR